MSECIQAKYFAMTSTICTNIFVCDGHMHSHHEIATSDGNDTCIQAKSIAFIRKEGLPQAGLRRCARGDAAAASHSAPPCAWRAVSLVQ